MCTLLVRYKDGTILTWNLERTTRLVDAMTLIRTRGQVCRVVFS